jgi:hypothetical protein
MTDRYYPVFTKHDLLSEGDPARAQDCLPDMLAAAHRVAGEAARNSGTPYADLLALASMRLLTHQVIAIMRSRRELTGNLRWLLNDVANGLDALLYTPEPVPEPAPQVAAEPPEDISFGAALAEAAAA